MLEHYGRYNGASILLIFNEGVEVQVKIFSKKGGMFSDLKKALVALEGEINDWLSVNPNINVIEIKQSVAGGSLDPAELIISLCYEEKSQQ